MATYRYGNNYRVAIGQETSLGSGYTNSTNIRFDDLTVLPDTINMVGDVAQIDTGAKTQSGLSTLCEYKQGYKQYTVTLSGYLSHEHEILLKALTPDTASPYCIDALPTLKSYVILRIWSDAVSTPYVADKAIGCQLSSLKITGTSGDMIRYEAVFMAQGFEREIASQAITGTDPGVVCTSGFNFGDYDSTTELCFGDTEHLKSFDLSLGYELADDATSYQNSNTRLETIPMKAACEFSYVTNHDTTNTTYDTKAETLLHSDTVLAERLFFKNTVKTWQLDMNGQLSAYTFADPGKALFENQVTERLIYKFTAPSTHAYPLTVTVVTL